MDATQIEAIKRTHALVAPVAAQAGATFYRHLFELVPSSRALFHGDEQAQAAKLMDMIASLVESLEQPKHFFAMCHELGQRHVGYGVEEDHYDAVGVALLRTLRECLGPAFDETAEEAWAALYGEVAEAMMARPGELLAVESAP